MERHVRYLPTRGDRKTHNSPASTPDMDIERNYREPVPYAVTFNYLLELDAERGERVLS